MKFTMDGKIMNEKYEQKCVKGFYRLTKQKYFKDIEIPKNMTEQFNIVDKVIDDGCVYEFMISFYKVGSEISVRAEIFSDAFVSFEKDRKLFERLSKVKSITPDELHSLLLELDYVDLSKFSSGGEGNE